MKPAALALVALLLGGCAARYQVMTNAYLEKSGSSVGIPAGASFAVLTNQDAPNPIFDAEVRSKIEELIARRGYRTAPLGEADFALAFEYDISGRTQTSSWPEFSEPGTRRVYTAGGTAYSLPTPGFSQLAYAVDSYTVYTARLFLKVLDGGQLRRNTERTVWVGDTLNESVNPDLRESIDYLLVSSFRYFGQDTGKGRQVVLDQNDPEVARLRGGGRPEQDTAKAAS